MTPEASCRIAFLIYDVAGPFVEGVPYAPIVVAYTTSGPNSWSISLKFRIAAGVTLSGWLGKLLRLRSYSKTVVTWTLKSWEGNW